jgi:PAS domain S-box-containing protein
MKPDFENLFNAFPGHLAVVDGSLNVVSANILFKDFARERGLITDGFTLTDLFPGNTVIVREAMMRAGRQKTTERFVIRDGSDKVNIALIPVPQPTGDFILVSITIVAGNAISSKELFDDLFEYNPAALAISSARTSVVINVNSALLRLFEFSDKAEVIGKTAAELKLMPVPEERDKLVQSLEKNRKVIGLEGNIRTRNGNVKWIAASVIMVTVDEEPCMMSVLLDITDRKLAEDRLHEMNQELEQLVEIKTREALQTELEYRSVVEQATDAIFISDGEGHYLDVNPSACELLGYTKDEFLEMTTYDLMIVEEVKQSPPRFDELRNGKSLLTIRTLRRKDGTTVPVEINARMLSNGRMLAMVRDITMRKRAEEEIKLVNASLEEKVAWRTKELQEKISQLEESEDRFHKAFKASSAGISITRLSDSTYNDVNDAFLNMIGYSRNEVIGKSSVDLGLIVDIVHRDEALKQIRETGSIRHLEMTIRKKSGELANILSSVETITHNGEKFAINIIYDITALKEAQEKLESVNRELEAFSYSVSHDLRAPLRSVIGYSEVIQEDFGNILPDLVKAHLKTIRKNASRMGQLIDDLLAFSKLGKQELNKTRVDMRHLVEKNILEVTNLMGGNTRFVVDDLAFASGDSAMLNQVWSNLISNAVKYSSRKEAPEVNIGCYQQENETVFFIRDNGAGFNMDFAAKLFGVFQRLHRASEFEGTGVGLALVKRIIDKHNGRIWAEGKEGEGATFYFSLPETAA